MQIDFWTLGLQAANFLVLVWLLHRFLYRPVQAAIAARQAEAEKLAADQRQARAAAEAVQREAEAQRDALAQSRNEVLAQARAAAEVDRQALLDKARRDADAVATDARKTLEREQAEAAQVIGRDAVRLAGAMALKVLNNGAGGEVQDRLLDQLCEQVEGLSADAKAQIVARLQGPGATFEVVTAQALPTSKAKRLRQRVAKAVGAPVEPALRVDPGLIAGGVVRFPFTVLTRAWSEDLDRIQAELLHDGA